MISLVELFHRQRTKTLMCTTSSSNVDTVCVESLVLCTSIKLHKCIVCSSIYFGFCLCEVAHCVLFCEILFCGKTVTWSQPSLTAFHFFKDKTETDPQKSSIIWSSQQWRPGKESHGGNSAFGDVHRSHWQRRIFLHVTKIIILVFAVVSLFNYFGASDNRGTMCKDDDDDEDQNSLTVKEMFFVKPMYGSRKLTL